VAKFDFTCIHTGALELKGTCVVHRTLVKLDHKRLAQQLLSLFTLSSPSWKRNISATFISVSQTDHTHPYDNAPEITVRVDRRTEHREKKLLGFKIEESNP
jgi:hypothetical protein